jgi:two-component system KDP operon response regulator KdpE
MTRGTTGPTILAVDDEPHVLQALKMVLESREYRVHTAASGAIALETFAAERPDALLLDLSMPGMDGAEVCRRIRAWSHVPILILSARTEEHHKVRALDAGADDYITKPFSTPELLARLRAALRREQARRDDHPVLEAGELRIDLVARRVMLEGREVHLTPTEYQLLRVLATNQDRVLTHRFLLTAVLGEEYASALENLRTFIATLRRKVETDSSRPRRIITEPGIGYRFIARQGVS